VPDRISHFLVDAEIGCGGMGVMYSAHHTRLGRAAAIKMLPPEATADPDRHRRFIQNVLAAPAFNHPHIVAIYEIDEDEGTTFIAMDLVDGAPLDTPIAASGSRSIDCCSCKARLQQSAHKCTETPHKAG
jgi:serine/threonine protein kinase